MKESYYQCGPKSEQEQSLLNMTEVMLRVEYARAALSLVIDGCRARLRFEWELDFHGDGSQGWLKVVVERTKPKLTEYDKKLRDQATKLTSLQAASMMVRMVTDS